jgi:hypothetical protein
MIIQADIQEFYKAVHEFCDSLGIAPMPWPDRVGTAVIIKPTK